MDNTIFVWFTYFMSDCINCFEYCMQKCKQQNKFDFIENDKGQVIYSFDKITKETKHITVHYTFNHQPYQIILSRTQDYSFQDKFNYIMTKLLTLKKKTKKTKVTILSSVLTETNGKIFRITNQLIQHSGPFGDFYDCIGYDYPMELIIKNNSVKNFKQYTTLSFIDNSAKTHIVQVPSK